MFDQLSYIVTRNTDIQLVFNCIYFTFKKESSTRLFVVKRFSVGLKMKVTQCFQHDVLTKTSQWFQYGSF